LFSNRRVHQISRSSTLRETHSTGQPTSSREPSAGFQVPGSFVRLIEISIVCFNGLLILATLLSDLGMTLPRGFGQFDLKLEGNFAAWYSSALLLLAGGAALLISVRPAPATVRPTVYRLAWTTTSLVFLGLSVDEMNELHERIGFWFTERFGPVPGLTDGYAIFGWVVALLPFIVLFIAGMSAMIHSWIRAHHMSRNLALAGLWCWIGVLAAEVTEAEMARFSMNRSVQGVVEEGLEITGTALFFAAFCEFLRSQEAVDKLQKASRVGRPIPADVRKH
jgi:hypothetical protein